jgi:putative ABC transport system permease protein
MKACNPLPLVLAELRRMRSAYACMVLLVALSLAISLAISALERGVREASTRAADRFDLIIGARGNDTQLVLGTVFLQPGALPLLDAQVIEQLRRDPGVARVAPVATGDSVDGSAVVGTTAEFASDDGRVPLMAGRWFARAGEAVAGADVPFSETGLGLGRRFRLRHGTPDENAIEVHEHEGASLLLVGKAAPTGTPWDRAILVPIETLQDLHARPDGKVSGMPALVVKPRSVGDAYRLRQAWRTPTSSALFPAETLTGLYRLLGDTRSLTLGVARAGQILVYLSVLLGMTALIDTQRATLAALRAMGAGPGYVLLVPGLQALAVVALGTLLGVMLGALACDVAALVISTRTGLQMRPGLGASEWWQAAAMLVLGGTAAWWPAWRVYRAPLGTALREQA